MSVKGIECLKGGILECDHNIVADLVNLAEHYFSVTASVEITTVHSNVSGITVDCTTTLGIT